MYFTVSGFMTDIITNSSSVVYTKSSPKEFITFVDELFVELGVDKRCSDLFDVFEIPSYLSEDDEFLENYLTEEQQLEMTGLHYTEQEQYCIKIYVNGLRAGEPEFIVTDYDYRYYNTNLLVLSKDGKETKLGKMVAAIFTSVASYDN